MYKLYALVLFCSAFFRLHGSLTNIDDYIMSALERFHVPGAVGVVVDDQVVLLKGYGYRHLEDKIPVTERTLFPIASCTKAFTALLLFQLAEEGKISLDDPVHKYIPEFSLVDQETASQMTIADLLAHRTGITRADPIWFCLEIGPLIRTTLIIC